MKHLFFIAFLSSGCLDFNSQVAECPSNTDCNRPPPSTLQLAAELLPNQQSLQVRQEIASIAFDQQGVATIRMVRRVTVKGRVFGDADIAIEGAQVIVSRPSLIPGGEPVTIQTTTSPTDNRVDVAEKDKVPPGTFSIDVPNTGGAAYSIRIVPQAPMDQLYPPATWPLTTPSDATTIDNFNLCLGNGGGTMCKTASGPAIQIAGNVADALDQGIAFVRVLAVEPESRSPLSSVASTDAKGAYQLHLSPNVKPDDMVLITATPDAKSALPTLERQVRASTLDSIVLHTPPLPAAQRFSLPVGGKSTSGVEIPLAGARIDFSTDLSSQNLDTTAARFTATVLTDEKGLANVDLIPGTNSVNRTYKVTVTPPADSIFSRSTFDVSVGPGSGVLASASLGLRPLLKGRLVDPSGQPVKSAVISAEPAASTVYTAPTSPTGNTVPMTVTTADGAFVLRVDPSVYDVELVPPPTESLVRWSVDNRAATDGNVDLGMVKLPRAVQTRVTVLDPEGMPAQGLEVRIYAVSFADTCPMAMGKCPLPARLRGDGVTGFDGTAKLLLPSP